MFPAGPHIPAQFEHLSDDDFARAAEYSNIADLTAEAQGVATHPEATPNQLADALGQTGVGFGAIVAGEEKQVSPRVETSQTEAANELLLAQKRVEFIAAATVWLAYYHTNARVKAGDAQL